LPGCTGPKSLKAAFRFQRGRTAQQTALEIEYSACRKSSHAGCTIATKKGGKRKLGHRRRAIKIREWGGGAKDEKLKKGD